jgi:hypothetical protein
MMMGNHDTKPIWLLAESWHGTAAGKERALYLAERLMPDGARRPRLAQWISADPRHLCQAMFADLFGGKARNVSVFCADLFGLREIYNRPGVVDAANWLMRLPSDFADVYRRRLRASEALNLPLALAFALSAKVTELSDGELSLLRRLLQSARELTPSLDEEVINLIANPSQEARSPRG